ncbi:hypothetical protein N1851_008398 [Merluccius polli]|uniref:Uncharacterized protein n=1 Tax=Merluccius polli TaxID=89951 RepID=A0AA47P4H4_MERPO|nr:hypothetical protein N1851_008398 [Merluccius polli]
MSGQRVADRTDAANCCPQTPDEVDISESILSDQLEITRSDLMDSPSPTEEESSVCEMDRTVAANCCPQTPDEVDISESILSDQLEITRSDLMDSPSPTDEELSVCEMDRTVAANCCPQTPDEVDISESILSDQLEITSSELTDSSSLTWEELSVCEITTEQHVYISLETSDEEDQQAEADEKVTRTRKPPSKMDKTVHGSNPQQRHIDVKMSLNKEHQRIYDKKNYCLYCEKPFAKLTRHLKQKHADMVEVAEALAHRQGSTQHRLLLEKIRNMGNYHHNCSVLSSGNGLIVPKRQATYLSSATDYLPCKFCFAMYVRKDLWRHHKRCKLQVKNDGPVKRKVQASSSLMLPLDTTISTGLQDIFQDMTYDIVTQVVKSDDLILSLGERMFLKNGEVRRHRADIRNKMRELARFVLSARKIDKDVIFLKDLINPGKFNTVLEAVKNMTGFDALTNRFSVPSTALKLRHSLVKVSHIVQGEALRQEDNALKGRAEQFIKLIELGWTTHVSSNAFL